MKMTNTNIIENKRHVLTKIRASQIDKQLKALLLNRCTWSMLLVLVKSGLFIFIHIRFYVILVISCWYDCFPCLVYIIGIYSFYYHTNLGSLGYSFTLKQNWTPVCKNQDNITSTKYTNSTVSTTRPLNFRNTVCGKQLCKNEKWVAKTKPPKQINGSPWLHFLMYLLLHFYFDCL